MYGNGNSYISYAKYKLKERNLMNHDIFFEFARATCVLDTHYKIFSNWKS
jgi:hypothetical protein